MTNMNPWVLIVHRHASAGELLASIAKQRLKAHEFAVVTNIAEARGAIAKRDMKSCRLVVCAAAAPRDDGQSPRLDGRGTNGIAFVRWLRMHLKQSTPVVFPLETVEPECVRKIARIANAHYFLMREMAELLPREIDVAVLGINDPTVNHMDVDIVLTSTRSEWFIHVKGEVESAPLQITAAEIERLAGLSRAAQDQDASYIGLIGVMVYEMLMDPMKSPLKERLRSHLKPYGGIEFARIRFSVDDRSHGILLLEAMAPPAQPSMPPAPPAKPDFWMLKTPMYRKFSDSTQGTAVFKKAADETIDLLLIEGCTVDFANGSMGFGAIGGAADEVSWLDEYLQENGEALGVRHTIVRHSEHGKRFATVLRETLERREFQMIHYAGHSKVDTSNQACLYMGPEEDQAVEIDTFALWTRHARFIFMSSCESANSQFIMRLTGKGVPAVLGFAWPIKDPVAYKFATTFYEKFFGTGPEQRLLEYSFLAGKKAVHRKWADTAHWAAPLLFMQPAEMPTRTANNPG